MNREEQTMPFADFREIYRQKLTTADEAVKIIKSGDWVDYGFCAIHPRVLTRHWRGGHRSWRT